MDPVVAELRAELEATRVELNRVQARLRRLEERFEYGWLRVLELIHAVSVLRSSVAALGHHLVQHFHGLVLDLRTRF